MFWPETLVTLAVLAALLAYDFVARRAPRWPRLPLLFLELYLLGLLVTPLIANILRAQGWEKWLKVGLTTLLAWAVIRLVFYVGVEWPALKRLGRPLPKITRDVVLLVCFSASAFVILRVQGDVNLAGLLTTSAVLTLVIGLAAQATLGNFFAGLTVQMERPFTIGDWIRCGDLEGEVHGITWKSTCLRTREDYLIYIPNTHIATSSFSNFTRPERALMAAMRIGLAYDAPPNKVRRIILDVVREHPKVKSSPPPEVRLVEFGDFAITYEIRFCHEHFGIEPRIKAEINNQLWYALRREGVRIPFPIRDVQIAHIERRTAEKQREQLRRDAEAVLAGVPLFAALPEGARSELARRLRIEQFGQGEVVVHAGEAGDSLYVIREGVCEVLRDAAGQAVAQLKAGDFFGEMTLLTGDPRSATVRAVSDTVLLAVDKEALAPILQANPALSEKLADVAAQRRIQLAAQQGQPPDPETSSRRLIGRIKSFFGLK